tara:strand:+ start:964 stop:1671 length:708 start_codon:yes stop_codon:yes gene_type:complete
MPSYSQECIIKESIMNIKMLKAAVAGLVLSVSGFANAGLIEHISNGDFETGDFTGWNVVNTGSGSWNINDGTFGTAFGTNQSIGGLYDVVSTQAGPGFHNLYQDVLLSNSFDSLILSWDDRIQSNAPFSDPNQEWRVLIEDITGSLIYEVYSTDPGDTNPQVGPNLRSYDLTSTLSSYAGQNIRVSFEQQDNAANFSATLDNVSFTSTVNVPEPSTLAIFALGIMGLASRRFKKQ